jgi:hypothetical protein
MKCRKVLCVVVLMSIVASGSGTIFCLRSAGILSKIKSVPIESAVTMMVFQDIVDKVCGMREKVLLFWFAKFSASKVLVF